MTNTFDLKILSSEYKVEVKFKSELCYKIKNLGLSWNRKFVLFWVNVN